MGRERRGRGRERGKEGERERERKRERGGRGEGERRERGGRGGRERGRKGERRKEGREREVVDEETCRGKNQKIYNKQKRQEINAQNTKMQLCLAGQFPLQVYYYKINSL